MALARNALHPQQALALVRGAELVGSTPRRGPIQGAVVALRLTAARSRVIDAHAMGKRQALIVVGGAVAPADLLQGPVALGGHHLAPALGTARALGDLAEIIALAGAVARRAPLRPRARVVAAHPRQALAAGLAVVGAVALVLGAALGVAGPGRGRSDGRRG